MTQTALILVDIQQDYFPGGRNALVGMEAAANNAERLLEAFRAKGQPTYHIQHFFPPNHPAGFFLEGTEGTALHSSIAPREGERVIRKGHPNSFVDTPLHDLLQREGIEELVICGAMSHMCIDATVRCAAELGYRVTVPQDACATLDLMFGDRLIAAEDVHGAFMNALGFAYASVVDTDACLEGAVA